MFNTNVTGFDIRIWILLKPVRYLIKTFEIFPKTGQFLFESGAIWWRNLIPLFPFFLRNGVYTLFLVHNTIKGGQLSSHQTNVVTSLRTHMGPLIFGREGNFVGEVYSVNKQKVFGGKVIFPSLSRYCATWLIQSYPNGGRTLILGRLLLPTGMPFFGNQTYWSIQTPVIVVQPSLESFYIKQIYSVWAKYWANRQSQS